MLLGAPTTITGSADHRSEGMDHEIPPVGTKAQLTRDGLQALIAVLAGLGYQVYGPTLRDGAIVYDSIAGVDDLPEGWTDRQEAGRYHVDKRGDQALFGYVVGPQSLKRLLASTI